MNLLEPISVNDTTLISSNLAETDASEWNIATAYVVDDLVISTTTHSVYQCVTAHTGDNPDTSTADPANWVRLSATNRWKSFDTLISDPALGTDLISYVIEPESEVIGIALFNLIGATVTVTVTKDASSYVYSQELINYDDVDGWYSWLFSGVAQLREALFVDLPFLGAGTQYQIDISATGPVQVGQIVLGKLTELGVTRWGANIGILDFSRKDRDAYGNAIIVERRFAQTASFPIAVDARRARRVQERIAEFRATPAVWIGDDRTEYALMIYGFLRSYTHVLELDNWSQATIEVEGLV